MLTSKLSALAGSGLESSPLPPTPDISGLEAGDDAQEWPRDAKWRPTPGSKYSPTPGGFNWDSPHDPAPPQGWGRPPSVIPEEEEEEAPLAVARAKTPSVNSVTDSHVFELEGSRRPVEIGGTPILGPGVDRMYSGDDWGGPGMGKK